jgi:DNA-binding MurR/RpiR family transcriptional regulator
MADSGYAHETVVGLVRSQMGRLTASERRVGRAFLAAYPIAGLETVGQLAERAKVSGPTVMRFVSKLGFDGYLDFQQALHREVQAKLTSSLALLDRQPTEPQAEILSSSLARFVDELRATFGGLPSAEFEDVVDLLCDERRSVLCTGGRFSQILAFYLAAHLNMLRPGCRYVDASPTPRFDELIDLGRRTIVAAFDYRRYQYSTIEFARRAADRGATIILFTDPWMSPLAEVARHVLTASVVAPSAFDSLVPGMAVVEAVIAGLSVRLGERARPRMKALERLRSGTTWGEVELAVDGSH